MIAGARSCAWLCRISCVAICYRLYSNLLAISQGNAFASCLRMANPKHHVNNAMKHAQAPQKNKTNSPQANQKEIKSPTGAGRTASVPGDTTPKTVRVEKSDEEES